MHSYLELLRDVLEHGRPHRNRTGVPTRRVIGRQGRFDLRERFPLLTTKHVSFRNVFSELRFFVLGRTDNAWLESRGCRIWAPWASAQWCAKQGLEPGDLGPIYGFQWRHFGATYRGMHADHTGEGVDQLRLAVETLQRDPDSRRIVVSAWNPVAQPRMALPPCHTLFQLSVVEGELYLHLYQRSADLFLGVPYNIASYACLTHMLAHVTDLRPGELIISWNDLHLYENHLDQVREQLSRTPRPLPVLRIEGIERGSGFEGLLAIEYEHLRLEGYKPAGRLRAPVAV
ncbi:MAG: thymidylate synthase [Planctomycetota bacterium]|nr:MAG: thymidylate synthase [Planctomycetota bacterium]